MMRFPAALAIAFAATIAQADPLMIETHYSPVENLEKIDVAQLSAAARAIDMAAYVLTDVAVIDALTTAAARGVKVRLYRNAASRESHGAVAAAFAKLAASPGVEIRIKHRRTLMHLKSYCIDGQTFRTGAANFSASGLKHQDNDLTLMRGETACAAFDAHFKTMWGE